MQTNRKVLLATVMACVATCSAPAAVKGVGHHDKAYFHTPEAARVGEQVMLYQRVTGGWPKNIDMERYLTNEERAAVLADKNKRNDSTTDNGATIVQMNFLAQLYQATADTTVANAVSRGVDYLLSGQYDNGGWPQFWPKMRDYQVHITYNDNAMVNTMETLRRVAVGQTPYGGSVVPDSTRLKAKAAFDRGVGCILRTQIVDSTGRPTIWCQQHDRNTLEPVGARSFELAGYCPAESSAIVALLMRIADPDPAVCRSIHAAMKWLDENKITGKRFVRIRPTDGSKRDAYLVDDPSAPPLWARYYDLKECRPFVCDRDGIMRRDLSEIGVERRTNYSWYIIEPGQLFEEYERWCKQHKSFPKQ